MSYLVTQMVAVAALPGASVMDRRLLAILAGFADDRGSRVRPSVAKLAGDHDIAERAARRAMKRLVKQGLIVDTGRRHSRGVKEYRIDLDKVGAPLTALTPDTPDTCQPRHVSAVTPDPLTGLSGDPLTGLSPDPVRRSNQKIQPVHVDPLDEGATGTPIPNTGASEKTPEAAPQGGKAPAEGAGKAEQLADELIALEGRLLAPFGVKVHPLRVQATRKRLVATLAAAKGRRALSKALADEGLPTATAEDIADALRGAVRALCASPHHRGENDSGKQWLLAWLAKGAPSAKVAGWALEGLAMPAGGHGAADTSAAGLGFTLGKSATLVDMDDAAYAATRGHR